MPELKSAARRTPFSRTVGHGPVTWIRKIVLSRFIWLLLGVIALGLMMNRWMDEEGGPRAVVQQYGIWAPLVSLVIQTVTTMTPLGAVLISIVNGMLFPLWLAVAINITSGTLGGIGMYYIWRRGDHEFDIQNAMTALPQWFRRRAGDNLKFLVLLRLLPWAGGSLADLIAGCHRIPLRTQFLSLLLGYLPGSVGYALLGAGLVPW